MASLEDAMTRRSPPGRDQHQAGRRDVEHLHASVGQQGEQLHDVEVVDQGVGQLHQRPGQQALL